MKRLTILFGSPRKTSNTRILAEEAARGAIEKGGEVEWLYLNDLRINTCQSCNACKAEPITRWCVQQDDMSRVYELIDRSDALLIASPIYFGYVPALVKACLDRLYPLVDPGFAPREANGKRVGFLYVQSHPDARQFLSPIRMFEAMFTLMGFEMYDRLIAPDLDQGRKPMADKHPDLMEAALSLGRGFFA
ncbi:MAG TPA: flavodoxin family protein [Candidatus Ozemobacteraceae bacterium]|nr:flavodoxin family protein [Candidatus Ozemobacteraceae bacterium]